MNKKYTIPFILSILFFAGLSYAAPISNIFRSYIPETDDQYFIGSTSPSNARPKAIYIGTGISTIPIASTTSVSIANLLNVSGTGTSTFGGSVNLPTGSCYQVNGTCVGGGGSGTVTGTGGTNMSTYWTSSTNLAATSAPTSAYFVATSSTASIFPFASTTALSASNLINVNGSGTSTFQGSINLPLGMCYQINGSCVGGTGGGGTVTGTGGTNMLTYFLSNSVIAATSGPTANIFVATSTTNASVFPIASTTSFSIGNILTTAGTGTSTFTGGISVAGINSTANGLRVTGDAIFSGGLQVNGGATSTFVGGITADTIHAANGMSIAAGCFSVNGNCIGAGTGSVTGTGGTNMLSYWTSSTNLAATSGPTATIFTATSTTAASTFPIASTTSFSIANLLTVAGTGTSTFNGSINLPTGSCFQVNGSCVGGTGGGGTPGGADTQVQYNSSGTFAGSANLIWDNTNGFLGIGTTAPYAELSIELNNATVTGTTTPVFSIGDIGTSSPLFMVGGGQGWVGIATSNPRATLAVGGNVLLGNDGANQLTLNMGNVYYPIISTTTFRGTVNALSFSTTTNSNTPLLSFDGANGRVGIWRNDPQTIFEVGNPQATSTFQGGLVIQNGFGTSTPNFVSDFSTGLTTASNFVQGTSYFDSDTGQATWMDMAVTTASAANDVQSYTARLDGIPLITVWGESDGAGSVMGDYRVGIASSTPWGTLAVEMGTSTNADLSFAFVVADQGTSSPIFAITNGGKIGVGTATPYEDFVVKNHISTGGVRPTVSSCGTGPTVGGSASDDSGFVTVGTGAATACTITFGTAYRLHPPICIAQDATDGTAVYVSAASLTAITITGVADFVSDQLNYICQGKQ